MSIFVASFVKYICISTWPPRSTCTSSRKGRARDAGPPTLQIKHGYLKVLSGKLALFLKQLPPNEFLVERWVCNCSEGGFISAARCPIQVRRVCAEVPLNKNNGDGLIPPCDAPESSKSQRLYSKGAVLVSMPVAIGAAEGARLLAIVVM